MSRYEFLVEMIYRYGSFEALVAGEAGGVEHPPLPGTGAHRPTARA